MSLDQMEVYVNEPYADLTRGANHMKYHEQWIMTGINLPHFKRLVFSDITLNPPSKYISDKEVGKERKKKLEMF